MKTHKTITITKKMLEKLGACSSGFKEALPFLPAKISTDPEQNVALAIRYAEMRRSGEYRQYAADISWLLWAAGSDDHSTYLWPDSYCFDNRTGSPEQDAFVVAQWLAWVADTLLTKAGK